MSHSDALTENDLATATASVDAGRLGAVQDARARGDADEQSAEASGVNITPTFFINARRFIGPWDESFLSDAMLDTKGHQVRDRPRP
jgi:NhaA family Na+:H+ antiporter